MKARFGSAFGVLQGTASRFNPAIRHEISTPTPSHLPHTIRISLTGQYRTFRYLNTLKRTPSSPRGRSANIPPSYTTSPRFIASMASYETALKGKYPAKAHAKKVIEYMRKQGKTVNGVLYLEGQKTKMIEDNDGEAPFMLVISL